MFLYLILLFTIVPAIELYFLITVGSKIGVIETIWIILITGVIGASFTKSQGKRLLAEIQSDLSHGEVPANKLIQGLLVLVGGILLITPGFLTDAVGLSMVIPITRIPFSLYLKYVFTNMIKKGTVQFTRGGFQAGFGTTGTDRPRRPHRTVRTQRPRPSQYSQDTQEERDVTPKEVIDVTPNKKK